MTTCQADKGTCLSPPRVWPMSSVMPPLTPLSTAPACAREFVRTTLSLWHREDLSDQAALITSELVTNAVQAPRPPYRDAPTEVVRVRILADRSRAVIEVWDEASGIPVLRDAGDFEEGGRGLTLVDAIADKWGWVPAAGRDGKCVWAEVSKLVI